MTPAARLSVVSSDLRDPPYPADTVANGWSPVFNVDRIYGSDTWTLAEDDERPWLLRIWIECWKSTPLGSMPSDRRLFSRRIGCKQAFLDAHAEILLRGWVLHSDGLLYHGFVAEQVLKMIAGRAKTSQRVKRFREENAKRHDESVTRYNETVTRYQRVSNGEDRTGQDRTEDPVVVVDAFPRARTQEPPPPPPCPVSEIVDLFHASLPQLGRVEKLTEARRMAIEQRWAEDLRDLDAWRRYFEFVGRSEYLTGRRPGTNGRPPFKATLAWLCDPENYAKVAEDKYHGTI